MRCRILSYLLLPLSVAAQTWNLSGKVVDSEEGNGVKGVQAVLARAGLAVTTEKDGSWSIGSTGLNDRAGVRPDFSGNNLVVLDGRLALRLVDADILGRRIRTTGSSPSGFAAREAAERDLDTLVFAKDGYVRLRIPLASNVRTGSVDSIHRIRYDGWVDSSHANLHADSLDGFFRGARTMTIHWSKQSWDHMMDVMADSCGAFGTRGPGKNGTTSKACSEGQNDYIEKSAMVWVPADIETDGQIWKNVGVRLKGNWSLMNAWTSKSYALPFRFNTDKFEDSLPSTKNQRFYGFQKVSLFNTVHDPSGIRGPIASAVFRQFGVVAPFSIPVHLILKFGDTTKDVGTYEMVEVPDEPLLSRYFENDSGNLYKPLSKLEQYVETEWDDPDIPGDRSDAKALISILNSNDRTSDSAKWHRDLESAIDVDGFLRWLAVSTVVNSWDSYGMYPHNYYLFNDRGRFRWITYDFGNSFNYTMGSRTSIWYNESSTTGDVGTYPLIRYLLADKGYCETYRVYATQALAGPASASNFQSLVDLYGHWVSSAPSTDKDVATLRTFMNGRTTEVQKSLNAKTCPIK